MADNTDTDTAATRRRPSPGLLLAGVAALLVSLWAFVGPVGIGAVAGGHAKWLLIAVAVVVGVVLVVSPTRRK
ncbi:hypothetical protein [Rhodococcus gannanensis]|uniref:Integral membrane protein n=1 Tax=Rhodococcus gannanensis TaxID=1960308 RepID=A0ABW4P2Z0_9NOCA